MEREESEGSPNSVAKILKEMLKKIVSSLNQEISYEGCIKCRIMWVEILFDLYNFRKAFELSFSCSI